MSNSSLYTYTLESTISHPPTLVHLLCRKCCGTLPFHESYKVPDALSPTHLQQPDITGLLFTILHPSSSLVPVMFRSRDPFLNPNIRFMSSFGTFLKLVSSLKTNTKVFIIRSTSHFFSIHPSSSCFWWTLR